MTVGLLQAQPPAAGDAASIAASLASPTAFAAVLRAAALIPGIELLDCQRDVAGRPGVGVAYDVPGRSKVLIFDPRTYELLGEREGGGGSADLESAIVSSIDERP